MLSLSLLLKIRCFSLLLKTQYLTLIQVGYSPNSPIYKHICRDGCANDFATGRYF
jgi:hypothetical protein